MAATNFTPISLYYTTTAAAAPVAGNLVNGELAINITDGKLYYKDNAGVVQLLASKAALTSVDTISFGTTGLTPATATTGNVVVAGTLITSNGGTGLTSYTAGDLPYYATGTALSKLGIGTSGQVLTSTGTAPQWSTLSGVAVTTFSGGTTGLTPSSATSGAITLGGTLVVSNGGTGLTSLTAGRIPFGAGTSALGNSANLFFDSANTRLGVGSATPAVTTELVGSDAVLIPKGNTAARPTGVSGYLRFNTTTSEFEGYNGTAWASVGGAALSNDTTTATNIYPLSAAATSGTASTLYTSNAKFLYKPSTGELQASALVASNGIVVNSQTVSTSYTIASGFSASSAGPITVAGGVTVTVASGSRWVVL
jgi:hypothetical protein